MLIRLSFFLPATLMMGILSACGTGEFVAVDITYRQYNDGPIVKIVSAIHVDSDGPGWQATHAANVAGTIAPDKDSAMAYCYEVSGEPRANPYDDFRALDLGTVIFETSLGDEALKQITLDNDRGVAFRTEPNIDRFPYTPGQLYKVEASGSSEAPAFIAHIEAPEDFKVERVGNVNAGAGTIPVLRSRDLRITWTPRIEQARMYIALRAGGQSVVCRVRDIGEFTIPQKMLSNISQGQASLILERFNQSDFETAPSESQKTVDGRTRYSTQKWIKISLQ